VSGLRERKKQRTRAQIVRAAMELFAERGFDRTTITDIAAAADISPRTFFGYFPAKEDVVFHDTDEVVGTLAAQLRGRAEGENAFDALRAWVLAYDEQADFASEKERARRRLIRETPSLTARERTHVATIESLLAEAVAEDLGVDPRSLSPHLVAAAAVAALDAIGRLHDEGGDADPPRSAEDVLGEAFAFLQGGLGALRRRSSPRA
jgi:AcrR family transcriptional regulator